MSHMLKDSSAERKRASVYHAEPAATWFVPKNKFVSSFKSKS
jgi:hypothetical protein